MKESRRHGLGSRIVANLPIRWLAIPAAVVATGVLGLGAGAASRTSFANLSQVPGEATPARFNFDDSASGQGVFTPEFGPGRSAGEDQPLPPLELRVPPTLPPTSPTVPPTAQPNGSFPLELSTTSTFSSVEDAAAPNDPRDPNQQDSDQKPALLSNLTQTIDDLTSRFSRLVIMLAVAAIATVLVARYGHRFIGRRSRRAKNTTAPPLSSVEVEALVTAVRNDPDHARAIRRAFSATDRGFAQIPPRRASETPLEWASQLSQQQPPAARISTAFSHLYNKARFSPHPASAHDREEAANHLQALANLEANPS